MLKEIKKNDEVITSGGVYGTVINVKDTTVILRIDDNVKVEILKNFISVVRKSAAS
jgi:preprotein translocase subunit YajC